MKPREEPLDPELDLGPEADPESVARKILLDQLTTRKLIAKPVTIGNGSWIASRSWG